jgi:hypothetical protein
MLVPEIIRETAKEISNVIETGNIVSLKKPCLKSKTSIMSSVYHS